MMQMSKISLKDYILAMETVNKYEQSIKNLMVVVDVSHDVKNAV